MGKRQRVGYLETVQNCIVTRSYEDLMHNGHYFDAENPYLIVPTRIGERKGSKRVLKDTTQ